jgi:hypothetical protein
MDHCSGWPAQPASPFQMPPSARISDKHACPAVTGVVPRRLHHTGVLSNGHRLLACWWTALAICVCRSDRRDRQGIGNRLDWRKSAGPDRQHDRTWRGHPPRRRARHNRWLGRGAIVARCLIDRRLAFHRLQGMDMGRAGSCPQDPRVVSRHFWIVT